MCGVTLYDKLPKRIRNIFMQSRKRNMNDVINKKMNKSHCVYGSKLITEIAHEQTVISAHAWRKYKQKMKKNNQLQLSSIEFETLLSKT